MGQPADPYRTLYGLQFERCLVHISFFKPVSSEKPVNNNLGGLEISQYSTIHLKARDAYKRCVRDRHILFISILIDTHYPLKRDPRQCSQTCGQEQSRH